MADLPYESNGRIPSNHALPHTLVEEQPLPGERAAKVGTAHIVVAVRLESRERDAVREALKIAASQRARVTLLHVMEPVEDRTMHWLDAIELLHRSLSRSPRDTASAIRKGMAELEAFLEREFPRHLRGSLDVRVECRVGDTATQIARFADEQAADLVFLCNRPSAWRLPLWPGLSQRLLRLIPKPVVFLHS